MQLAEQPLNKLQPGYTLIELVIGGFIGLIVIGSIFAIYAPTLQSYKKNNAMSVIQETERFAIASLNTAVQQAGYFGCNSSTRIVPSTGLPKMAYVNTFDYTDASIPARLKDWAYSNTPIQGFTANATAIGTTFGMAFRNALLADGASKIGDVLMLTSGMESNLVIDSHDVANEQIMFKGNQTTVLKKGMILQLNNCESQAVAFQIDTSAEPAYDRSNDVTTVNYSAAMTNNCTAYASDPLSSGDLATDTGKVYLGGAIGASCKDTASRGLFSRIVYREFLTGTQTVSTAYFLRADKTNENIPTLYRLSTVGAGSAESLLEGVENFRVMYGRDTSGNGAIDLYQNAATLNATPANWASVRTIKVSLLVRSLAGKGESDQVQNFSFPKASGTLVNCISISPDAQACPGFMFTDFQKKTHARRVIEKVFSMRNRYL